MKCDTCLNSRPIVSENGIHYACCLSGRAAVAHRFWQEGYDACLQWKPRWIPVEERLPKAFVSVLGYMTDAGGFPAVRECYRVGGVFFFPALRDIHPVSHWMPMPTKEAEV